MFDAGVALAGAPQDRTGLQAGETQALYFYSVGARLTYETRHFIPTVFARTGGMAIRMPISYEVPNTEPSRGSRPPTMSMTQTKYEDVTGTGSAYELGGALLVPVSAVYNVGLQYSTIIGSPVSIKVPSSESLSGTSVELAPVWNVVSLHVGLVF